MDNPKSKKVVSALKTIALVHLAQSVVWALLGAYLTFSSPLPLFKIVFFSPVFFGMALLATGCLWVIDKQRSKQRSNPEPDENSSN